MPHRTPDSVAADLDAAIVDEMMRTDAPAPSPDTTRDAHIRVLLAHSHHLAMQIHDLVEGQKATDERLDRGTERMDALQKSLDDNTSVTTEVRDILNGVKLGFKVLNWVGAVAKPLLKIAGLLLGLYAWWYAATHNGASPWADLKLPKGPP